ncbi:hypothetical protein [Halomarina ordinaria]|uniref:Halobacterial output domain-containing protein n=1 Tax=Halomarina ordinaria TaxID=3033939 RepID=A0ABD5UAB8_9EURY|nr:hypothetical protein [Halomarina sp. PSRA2]
MEDTLALSLGEWDRVVDALDRFARSGTVTAGADAVRADFGSASLELARDGRVDAGMPLHEFSTTGEVTLHFDFEAGELTVADEGLRYTFRRP